MRPTRRACGGGIVSGDSTRITRGPVSFVFSGCWSFGPAGATTSGRAGTFMTGATDSSGSAEAAMRWSGSAPGAGGSSAGAAGGGIYNKFNYGRRIDRKAYDNFVKWRDS